MEPKAFVLVTVVLLSLSSLVLINGGGEFPGVGPLLVKKESRRTLVSTESGEITAVDVPDGCRGSYHLQFITMEPSSLFLPVLLHSDMVFYVHTGSGRVTYISEDKDDKTEHIDVERGDIYRLKKDSIFYMQSHPDPTGEKLNIHAIFTAVDIQNTQELPVGAYSTISDLVRGFDERVLQKGFGVSEETIRAIKWVESPPSILPFERKDETNTSDSKEELFGTLRGIRSPTDDDIVNKKKKKKEKKMEERTFNFYKTKPDVENCNGWSTTLTHKDLKALKGSNFGAFMVKLSKGSMMGPHWNPKATEIAMMIHGAGAAQVVCPSKPSGETGDIPKCQETRFKVKEGDVLVVPRYHPVTQMSYNNGSLVFIGFSSLMGKNHLQFLAGKRSVLRTIDRAILATTFNVPNTTIADLLVPEIEPTILECTSCAEELEGKMEEEPKREKPAQEEEEEEKGEAKEEEEKAEEARRREEGAEAREREGESYENQERQERREIISRRGEEGNLKKRKLELKKKMWMLQMQI